MKNYGLADEHTPLTKTPATDYVYMTNPNRLFRKQVHQFQCCICAVVLIVFGLALAITILYSVDNDTFDVPDLPADNASLQLLLSKSWPLPDNSIPSWQIDTPSPEEMEAAVSDGKKQLAAKDKLESTNLGLPVNSPSYRHQVSIKTSARATNLARSAFVMEAATKSFVLNKAAKSKNVTKEKAVGRGPMLATDWLPAEECGVGPLPACPPAEYRTVEGTCNNPYKPNMWGVAMRPFRRQLPPDYADGISQPRAASDGSPLPSARAVSITVHRPIYRDDPKFTVMLAVWGQFMDHDLTAFALSLGAGGKPISCCVNASVPAHPECFPVYLDADDPYYQQFGVTCMEFVRSAPAPTCALGPREQMNQVSSYLDGSVVYGNTPELSRALRSYQGGQLKMLETADGRTLLPISTILDDGCNREAEIAKGRYCFMTGDSRANENTHLTSLHLLLARQHNLLATQLSELNPEWNDEKLYQESRKIIGAQMQHITYNEFLPVLLGPDLMEKLDLTPKKEGYYSGYDATTDATISNNFATSAFRFAHTLLPALMKTVAKDWGSEESVEMHKMLFDPFKLYQTGALDKMLQGAINTKLERADSYFNPQLTQHLFQATGEDDKPSAPRYGLDLVSLNVQRGRDHGLPAYPVWREFCGLSRPKSFDDMVGMVDEGSLERIRTIYKSVEDIDMYTGALSEFPIEGGLVGPTITCLVGDQFKRLKQGDDFWYETDKQPQAFSLGQLEEIRKTSLAQLICDTSDDVTTVQAEVMKSVDPLNNIRVPCSTLPRPDLTKWAGVKKFVLADPVGKIGKEKKPKYARIGVSVTSGIIKTLSGTTLWDGSLPIVVPLPVFTVKKAIPGAAGVFGHGIQWQGTISESTTGIDISGSFSYPVYSHGPIPLGTNYTIKWVNGDFQFDATVTSNDSDISQLTLPGTYESPIFFSEKKLVVKETDTKKQFVLGATEDTPSVIGIQKLPLILIGSYAPDNINFVWSGIATITIPIVPPLPIITPSDIKPPSMIEEEATSGTGALSVIGPKLPSISGAFNVISGKIKLQSSDGSTQVLWDGKIPAAIPLPLPYKVLMAVKSGEKLPVIGSGLVWSASISGSSLEGSFTFPQYNRSVGFLFVNWLDGQFSFEVLPLMENATLDQLLVAGVQYSSRLILREEPATPNLQINEVFNDDVDAPGSLEDLVVESQEVIDGIVRAPLILHGTFSPDKTTFYFNGKVILAVRPSKPKMDKQLKLLKSPELTFPPLGPYGPWSPWASPKYGGMVNSGHVTAGLNGASPTTIWSGSVPAAIPMPSFFSPIYDSLGKKNYLFGNGVVWSGTLSGSTISGTYYLVQTIWSMTGLSQQTYTGEFSFEIAPLWTAAMESLFVPGAKYYSKISFQGMTTDPGITSLEGVPGADPSVAMSAPLILQGTYSLDKTTFYWSGGFIIKFRNKPVLTFKVNKAPSLIVNKGPVDKPKASIELDVTSGSITAGFTDDTPQIVWSGKLPATIPYANLMSSEESWRTFPEPNVMWTGEVVNQTFKGTFAVPTYKPNGTSEIIQWWAGNFSVKYTTKWGALLENYIKEGKTYDFGVIFGELKKAANPAASSSKSSLVKFTQEAQKILGSAKEGKLILRGSYYSKPFYCYIIPLCSTKQEYYWSGKAILSFPDLPKNKSDEAIQPLALKATAASSAQFGGQVVSGKVQGGLTGEKTNVWWTGTFPVQIPTQIFWTNITTEPALGGGGLIGGRTVDWSGTVLNNTLKGTFSFPQLVQNFPLPSVQWWSGQFSFDFLPLWNTTLDGLIQPEVTYSSGVHFQGVKVMDEESEEVKQFKLGDAIGLKRKAPIILQGTLSPDGSNFLWSGKFVMSVKSPKPVVPLQLKKAKTINDIVDDGKSVEPATHAPVTPVKPAKLSLSFTVLTGELTATNGSDPITFWRGEIPAEINTDMFNPTAAAGAGASITWTPESISPDFTGTFSVRVYQRNGQIVTPVNWSGNFSMHYLIKWSGALDGLVVPGHTYTCNVIFKEIASKKLGSSSSPGDIVPLRFVVGAPATPCSLIINGKNYIRDENPFYCKVIPFMCTQKPLTNMFSFGGDAMVIMKPPAKMSPLQAPATPTDAPPSNTVATIPRRINTTVISGSITAAPEPEFPKTLWSGEFPLTVALPVFWNSEDPSNAAALDDTVHTHGVIWSGYQMGPRVEGTFSLPQYSKTGVKWWTGRFNFLFQTAWGNLGDLDEFIKPGITYNSKLVFRDIHTPTPVLAPTQFDVDTSTDMPLILLGTYSPDRKIFNWSGNVIIGIRSFPWNLVNQSPLQQLAAKPTKPAKPGKPGKFVKPTKPTSRVGVLISKGTLINNTNSNELPLWTGSPPVTVPLTSFNVSKGVNIIWTATALSPKLEGIYSIPQYAKNSEGFKIVWMDGTFSFDMTTLWNTTLDLIEVGKQYATVVSSNLTKLTKTDKQDQLNSILSLIMDSAGLQGSQIGRVNLNGIYSPDKLNFVWAGEAWFNLESNKTVGPKLTLPAAPMPGLLRATQFGGSVIDGWITAKTDSFFSFSSTIWSGTLPAEIPISALWSASIFGGSKLTREIIWTPTSVTDDVLMGSYSVPQISWDGITTSVTWYKGDFKLFIRPLWLSSLPTLIQPGVQYYSRISFQGGLPTLMVESKEAAVGPEVMGIKAPIILQGNYSPDGASFFWTGNFIINVKVKTPKVL